MNSTTSAPLSATPRITVVTVVYNGVREIAGTIESTVSQDYPDMEYVIVDGGSTDGTQDVVAGYCNSVDVVISEPDKGIYDAMNKAISLASGSLLLFMNCGDRFANVSALSTAARQFVTPSEEQIIFGAWERRKSGGRVTPCRPNLSAGFFNHQAVLYSRSLHQRFGHYVTVSGLTTADYLFFATVMASDSVRCTCIDNTIAVIDVEGVSQGLQTFSQKFAIDFLLGRASRMKLLMVLALHPVYRRSKKLLGKLS